MEQENFIITFGQQHTHRINNYTFDKDCVAVIRAETLQEAHDIAMDIFDEQFHRCSQELDFDLKGSIQWYPRGKYNVN